MKPEELSAYLIDWEKKLRRYVGNEKFEFFNGLVDDSYRVIAEPRVARDDVEDVCYLIKSGLDTRIRFGTPSREEGLSCLKVITRDHRINISDIIATLVHHGFSVLDEYSFELGDGADNKFYINIYRVRPLYKEILKDNSKGRRVCENILDCLEKRIEDDPLSVFLITLNLSQKEVNLLRAIHSYIRQIHLPYSRQSVYSALIRNPRAAKVLFKAFRVKFDPDLNISRKERLRRFQKRRGELGRLLRDVKSLEEDRIISIYFNFIDSCCRTNFYMTDEVGRISFKIECEKIHSMPSPRPWREIYLYGSVEFEGCHLRKGPVARGGIRWSERYSDFRSEILGLMKAQVIKNAQIVPTGAKGGFVAKKILNLAERKDIVQEIEKQYRNFIDSLLEIQDNVVEGKVKHPERVIHYDGNDPYLVVAADKGTASFSDIANEISAKYGFWLKDAFASGGKNGYDHKKLGITARGAFESLKRHAWELGKTIERDPFTMVGIGDMSGDVFGNGVLLSDKIKLVAAFDHRHIFIDPEPDPRKSFLERRRLFRMKRSSWDDYDRGVISEGGGVYSRAQKDLEISPKVQNMLKISRSRVSPNEMIRAILKADVDVLYNGGIGTFVKAEDETHEEVGDLVNRSIRVDARELQCAIVVEGGNLGMTQRARIEYCRNGGRVYSDSIDNSAGVDISDQEVNLKILLDNIKRFSKKQRANALHKFEKPVVASVLKHNSRQTLSISLDEIRSKRNPRVFEQSLQYWEKKGLLNIKQEILPDEEEFRVRQASGRGLFKPELGVMLAYAKMDLKERLLDSPIAENEYFNHFAANYFPSEVREEAGKYVSNHPLYRDLLVTVLSNFIINAHGSSIIRQLTFKLGLSSSRICEALVLCHRIFRTDLLFAEMDALAERVPAKLLYHLYLDVEDAIIKAVVWFLKNIKNLRTQVRKVEESYMNSLDDFYRVKDGVLNKREQNAIMAKVSRYRKAGLSAAMARRLAVFDHVPVMFDINRISLNYNRDWGYCARAFYEVEYHLDVPLLIRNLLHLPVQTDWGVNARNNLVYYMRASVGKITRKILKEGQKVEQYFKVRPRSYGAVRESIDRLKSMPGDTISPYVVIADQIRDLAGLS